MKIWEQIESINLATRTMRYVPMNLWLSAPYRVASRNTVQCSLVITLTALDFMGNNQSNEAASPFSVFLSQD